MSKLNYIMAEKSQSDALFYQFFIKFTALMPILIQKDVHSLTNTLLSYPYFVVKSFILSKTLYSHVIFFQLLYEKPRAVIPYLIKKSQFCQNYIILWIKKVNKMLFFFPIFHGKNTSLMPIFCQENVHSRKNTLLPSPHFYQKISKSLKNTVL